MELYLNKNMCSGCSACYNICPVRAINMEEDNEGFEYPVIDKEKCINCGFCKKVCQFNENYDTSDNIAVPEVYSFKHRDEAIRSKSRSGGAFFAIAEKVIKQDGVVYGVALDDELVPKHIRVTELTELTKLQGSKYVEAEIGSTFKDVENDLKNGKFVLFASTACKVAAIESYISQRGLKENLFTVDLICHGVPSRKAFKDYINYQNKRFLFKIRSFDFRDKSFGWNTHLESFILSNNKKIVSSMWRNIFFSEYTIRPSCSNCFYTNKNRPADITLGDFWGIDKLNEDFNDNKGVSCVILNTAKAVEFFNNIEANKFKTSIDECHHNQLKKPVSLPKNRELFWAIYNQKGFINALEYVFGKFYGLKMTIKSYIRLLKK